MSHRMELTGQSFAYLTVLGFSKVKKAKTFWLCKCLCGNEVEVAGNALKTGNTKSCGCHKTATGRTQMEILNKYADGRSKHYLYPIWFAMHSRCSNVNDAGYKNYGARDIHVIKEWDDFWQFVKDMGKRPSINHTLERVNNDMGYSKVNCRWATMEEQQNNKRKFKSLAV